jgi:CheY-like chemotaxis protein
MSEVPTDIPTSSPDAVPPIRVLLLDDDSSNLLLRAVILRQHGYACVTATSEEEALQSVSDIDVAVLDYHLGAGQFGTDVAVTLRKLRPEVPIIILSATLEHRFGGVEDMHLLKGYSSNDDLLGSLRALEAKRRGVPVVVDARDFFYSRIGLAIGADVLIQIFDASGDWIYCNETAADRAAARVVPRTQPVCGDAQRPARLARGDLYRRLHPRDLHRSQPARIAQCTPFRRPNRCLECPGLSHHPARRPRRRGVDRTGAGQANRVPRLTPRLLRSSL